METWRYQCGRSTLPQTFPFGKKGSAVPVGGSSSHIDEEYSGQRSLHISFSIGEEMHVETRAITSD